MQTDDDKNIDISAYAYICYYLELLFSFFFLLLFHLESSETYKMKL